MLNSAPSQNFTRQKPNSLTKLSLILKPFFVSIVLFTLLAFMGYLSTLSLLKIEMDTGIDSELEVFWANEREAFSTSQSRKAQVTKGKRNYWIWINNFNKSTRFRLDPINQKAVFKLHSAKLYSLHYYPVDFHPIHDVAKSSEIQILVNTDHSSSYITIQSLGNDPQIELRVIHSTNPFIYGILFALITAFIFRKKALNQALLLIFTSILLSYLLTLNAPRISFKAQLDKQEQIKLFWRNAEQNISTTRAEKVTILPSESDYSLTIGGADNIDVLYLESSNDALQSMENLTVHAIGIKDNFFSPPDATLHKRARFKVLGISIAVFLGVSAIFVLGLLYYPGNKHFFYIQLFPKLIRTSFLFASLLVFGLAWQADYNIHPDENAHIESTKYYSQYWVPPKVGDPRSVESYQKPWATSRLDDLGLSYFFAGKFSLLVKKMFADETFIYRAFNALLFLLLFIMSANKRLLLFLAPLLCTPQIWYLFAYANRGAFVLFVSLLMAWQLVNEKSLLKRFLATENVLSHWHYAVFPGVLLGVLSIEQTNYLLFILFVFSVLLWELLFFVAHKKTFMLKCLFLLLIGASVFFVRNGIDTAINGNNKLEQRTAYAEQHAEPDFKPSIAETNSSYPGLRLKAKGVSLAEIFQPKWEWHKMTFKSFTGFYGYYAHYSPKWYYAYVLLVYCIVFVLILQHVIFKASWRYKLFSILSVTAISGGLLMSILFSWLFDFQPQGRYIFPIIPIILVFFWKMFPLLNREEKTVLLTSGLALIFLSFYSFRNVALNYLFS